MKLSIIIPIYNVEKYIERCLNSCVDQKGVTLGRDYEIICINDGTKDKSADIAKSFASNYDSVIVINQENAGLSAARNKGLSLAKGEYVWFVDSDDWIEPNCLCIIIPHLYKDYDLIQIEYRKTYDDDKLNKDSNPNPIRGVVDGIFQTKKGGLHTPAQFVICRKKFLEDNNLSFKEGIYHEDGEFRPRSILPAKRIISIPDICYNYYQRGVGSIMSNFKMKNVIDLFYVMDQLCALAETQERNVKIALYGKLGSYMNTLLYGIYSSTLVKFDDTFDIFKEHHELFKKIFKCNNIKYKIESLFFMLNIKLGFMFYKIIK